jgi:hypothetical protein
MHGLYVIVGEGNTVVGKVPALAADAVEQQTSLWKRLFEARGEADR